MDPSLAHTHTFYEGVGCLECNGSGFRGRMAICELLDLTDHIREIILDRRPISEVKRAAREQGMRLLRESAVERVSALDPSEVEGTTAAEPVNMVSATHTMRTSNGSTPM